MSIFMNSEAHILIKIISKRNFILKEKLSLKMKRMLMLYQEVNFLIRKQSKPCMSWQKIILLEETDSKKIIRKQQNYMANLLHKIIKILLLC